MAASKTTGMTPDPAAEPGEPVTFSDKTTTGYCPAAPSGALEFQTARGKGTFVTEGAAEPVPSYCELAVRMQAAEAEVERLRAVLAEAPPAPNLQMLIAQWREKALWVGSHHATMGTGWKVCADELEKVLAEAGRSSLPEPKK